MVKIKKELNKLNIATIIVSVIMMLWGLYGGITSGFDLKNLSTIAIGMSIVLLVVLD